MTRLLFVDDEPRVLDGLRLSLRSKRKEWEMVFVDGANAALDELAKGAFTAVISDMRMPGIDGAALLTQVRALQPEALRIVLSGQMDEASAVRAAAAAHRFIAKPCAPSTLIDVLSRAVALHTRLGSMELRHHIGRMTGLPSLPDACARVSDALNNEQATVEEVTELVAGDVGMSVRVLQLVNSGFFGLPRRLASVEQAVSYLGLQAMRSLMRANALFHEPAHGKVERVANAQAHALLAAHYARGFALGPRQSEVAVTAALLRNVGELAFVAFSPSEAPRPGDVEVGAYLLGLWGVPDDVIAAAGAEHTQWASVSALDANVVVDLADLLSDGVLAEVEYDHARLPEEALRRLGIAEAVGAIVSFNRLSSPPRV